LIELTPFGTLRIAEYRIAGLISLFCRTQTCLRIFPVQAKRYVIGFALNCVLPVSASAPPLSVTSAGGVMQISPVRQLLALLEQQ